MKEIEIVKYSKDMGDYSMPEGAEELLRGLSIEEQLKHFSIFESSTSPRFVDCERSVFQSRDTKAVIVNDGIVVGVMISNEYGNPRPCYIGERVCTLNSSDNNGAGYKSRTDYSKLLFKSQE